MSIPVRHYQYYPLTFHRKNRFHPGCRRSHFIYRLHRNHFINIFTDIGCLGPAPWSALQSSFGFPAGVPPTRLQPLRSRKRHHRPPGVYFCHQESFCLSVPKKRIRFAYSIPPATSGEHRALHFRMRCPH